MSEISKIMSQMLCKFSAHMLKRLNAWIQEQGWCFFTLLELCYKPI